MSRTRVRVDLPNVVHEVATEDAENGHNEGEENQVETSTPATAAAGN